MSKEALVEVFGDDDPTRYEAEAGQRWGSTEAFAASTQRRVKPRRRVTAPPSAA